MNERPSWDSYFLEIAHVVAKRATCSKKSVGAVFVRDNRILCTGYNGAPGGERHCKHEEWAEDQSYNEHTGRLSCIISVHAELNAIIHAALDGISLRGATLYVTHPPCEKCSKHLRQLRLVRIVTPTGETSAL